MIIAEKHLDVCENKVCIYGKSGKCCFGMRDRWGCPTLNPDVEKLIERAIGLMDLEINGLMGLCDENNKNVRFLLNQIEPNKILRDYPVQCHTFDIVDRSMKKVFDFYFDKHHYTLRDNARDQSKCPYCDNGIIGREIRPKVDENKFEFLGIKYHECNKMACFKCIKCDEHLFFHVSDGWIKAMKLR